VYQPQGAFKTVRHLRDSQSIKGCDQAVALPSSSCGSRAAAFKVEIGWDISTPIV
jgi:hypothetical protein